MKDYESTVRYSGPDGAKRLEMLEELAESMVAWAYGEGDIDWATLDRVTSAIYRDNERVVSELKR